MKKETIKQFLIMILTLITVFIIGLILLALAFSLPTEKIYAHVKDSVPMLIKEKDYFSVTPSYKYSQLDNYTDSIYLREALVGTKDANIIKCILSGLIYNGSIPQQQVNKLEDMFAENTIQYEETHYRFFNGYEIFVKPLLIFTDYSGIRQLNMYLAFLLLILFCYLLYKRGFAKYILPIIISLLFINLLTVSLCMAYVGFYYCMIIPSILMLMIKKETLKKNGYIFFEIIGACAFCFNMNYFQLLSFAMPYIIYLLICGFPKSIKDTLKTFICLFVAWFIGYAGIMLLKWTIYSVIFKPDMFKEMLDCVFFRTSNNQGSRISGVFLNIKTGFLNIWWVVTELVFIVYYINKYFKNKLKLSINRGELALLLIMIAMPICRYIIFSNHVTIHYWTTYRLLMIPILAFNILLVRIGEKNELDKNK